jgi:hypothetical protein
MKKIASCIVLLCLSLFLFAIGNLKSQIHTGCRNTGICTSASGTSKPAQVTRTHNSSGLNFISGMNTLVLAF